jgi:hypothetical protein
MLVVAAAFVTKAESQKPRAPDTIASNKKCSRSPLHRAAAFPLQQLRMLSELSALKNVFGSAGPRRLFAAIVN